MPEPNSNQSRLEELQRRVEQLSSQLAAFRSRSEQEADLLRAELLAIRRELHLSSDEVTHLDHAPAADGTADLSSAASPQEPWLAEVIEPPAAVPVAPVGQPAEPATAAIGGQPWGQSLEARIGGKWLTWLGSLVLLVAVGFGVHWAWTTFETPAWLQVTALHLLGLSILAGGCLLRRGRLPILSQAIAGLGVFTLYCVALASLRLYEVWPTSVAFSEFTLITIVAIFMALWLDSPVVVLVGALGGYLTPILTSSGSGDHVMLFSYLAFLNAALIATAVWKSWSFLKPVALMATALMFLVWMVDGYHAERHLWSTEWLIALHAGIFLLGTTLPPWAWRQSSTASDLFTLSANAMWFLGMTRQLFHDVPGQQLALVCWGLAAGHLALMAITYARVPATDRMPRVQLALAAVFATLAAPLQLNDLLYLGPAWCVEGLVFLLVGIYFHDLQMRFSGMIVFALALAKFVADYFHAPVMLTGTAIEMRFAVILSGGLLMIAAGTLYLALRERLDAARSDAEARIFPGLLLGVGNLLAMAALTCQWDGRLVLVLWTLDTALIWTLAFWFDRQAARWYGLGLATLLVGLRTVYHFDHLSGTFSLIFNARFASLALVAALYFIAGWFYRKRRLQAGTPTDGTGAGLITSEVWVDSWLGILANTVLVAALTLELHDWFIAFGQSGRQPLVNMRMARLAGYSILWAVYAALVVAGGFVLRYRLFRLLGLAAFVPILIKVFFIDLAELELMPRVLAFGVLGLMLLGVSWLYQRFAARVTSD